MNKRKTLAGFSAAALAAGTAATVGAVPASAEEKLEAEHCLTEALSPSELERGAKSTIQCFDEFADVAKQLGYEGDDADTVTAERFFSGEQKYAAAASGVLAQHADYFGVPGTITISGTNCNGGGVQLSSNWINRIDATLHKACGTIKHYDTPSYGGAMEQTQGANNALVFLSSGFQDKTSSIKYYL